MSRSTRTLTSVLFAGLFTPPTHAFAFAEGNGDSGGARVVRTDDKGIVWKAWPVRSEGKDVGSVVGPEFDEKNPDQGMKQISEFNWSTSTKAEDGTDLGYPAFTSWKQAVVSILNTQHSTNLRNRLRQAKSGKVSSTQIDAMAFARITMPEFQACVGDPAKLAQLKDQKVREVKAELEAKKAAGQATAAKTDPAGAAQEEADAETANA